MRKTGILLIVILGLSVTHCKSRNSDSEAKNFEMRYDNTSKMVLGNSFDERRWVLKQAEDCVTGEVVDTPLKVVDPEINVQFVNNYESLATALKVSAEYQLAAQVAEVGSANVEAKLATKMASSFSQNVTWAVINVKVNAGKKHLSKVVFTDKYKKYFDEKFKKIQSSGSSDLPYDRNISGGDRPAAGDSADELAAKERRAQMRHVYMEFFDVCGTAFLNSIAYGGEIIAVFRMKKNSKVTKQQIESQLKTQVGVDKAVTQGAADISGGSTYDVESEREAVANSMENEVSFFRIGGSNDIGIDMGASPSYDQFAAMTKEFVKAVAAGGANPVRVKFHRLWEVLAVTENIPPWLVAEAKQIGMTLKDMAGESEQVEGHYNDWKQIEAVGSTSILRTTVRNKIKEIEGVKRQLKTAFRACLVFDTENCATVNPDFNSIRVPDLHDILVTTKVVTNNIRENFFDMWVGHAMFPECVLKVEVCATRSCKMGGTAFVSSYRWNRCTLSHRVELSRTEIAAKVGRFDDLPKVDDLWLRVSVLEAQKTKWRSMGSAMLALSGILSKEGAKGVTKNSISNMNLHLKIEAKNLK